MLKDPLYKSLLFFVRLSQLPGGHLAMQVRLKEHLFWDCLKESFRQTFFSTRKNFVKVFLYQEWCGILSYGLQALLLCLHQLKTTTREELWSVLQRSSTSLFPAMLCRAVILSMCLLYFDLQTDFLIPCLHGKSAPSYP